MKRLVALFALACLIASPAFAGITALNGGGTGGTFATGSDNATSTTVTTAATTVAIPAGSLSIIFAGQRAGAGVTINSCTDSAGNTYSSGASTNSTSNATVRIFYSITTSNLPIGGTASCTYSSLASIKTISLMAFSGAAASPFDVSVNASASSTGSITIGPVPAAGNLACNASAGEVVVSVIAMLNGALPSALGSFTSLGYQSNQFAAYQIVNSNAAVTFTPTLNGASGNWASQLQGFKAAVCLAGGGNHGLLLSNVGN